MTEKIHQIIQPEDIKDFLERKKVFTTKKNTKTALIDALDIRKLFAGKKENRNYAHLGHMITGLRAQNDANQDKEYYIIPNDKRKAMYERLKAKQEKDIKDDEKNFLDKYEKGLLKERSDKHFFVLTQKYIQKIEAKTGILTKDQRIKLEIAFLITQQAFSRKMRKDGFTPYFRHITGVLDNVLMLRKVSFDQVMDAILHDNLEDIDYHSYDMLKKLFGTRIAEGVYALTEKKRYHRIGFLPLSKRGLLRKLVNMFTVDTNNEHYLKEENFDKLINNQQYKSGGTKEFLQTFAKSEKNAFQGLQEGDRLPPTIEKHIKESVSSKKTIDKNLLPRFSYDPEYKDIFDVCRNVSEFAYLNKRLDEGVFKELDELLPIKFSDRIHNLSTLWFKNEDGSINFTQPSKRVAKLLETEYHFLDNKDLSKRLGKHGILLKDMDANRANIVPNFMGESGKQEFSQRLQKINVTHYDVLEQQVAMIKEKDPKIRLIMKSKYQGEESLYDRAKNLYRYQNDIIKEIQDTRKKEKQGNFGRIEKLKLEHDYKRLVTTIRQLQSVYEEMDSL